MQYLKLVMCTRLCVCALHNVFVPASHSIILNHGHTGLCTCSSLM